MGERIDALREANHAIRSKAEAEAANMCCGGSGSCMRPKCRLDAARYEALYDAAEVVTSLAFPDTGASPDKAGGDRTERGSE